MLMMRHKLGIGIGHETAGVWWDRSHRAAMKAIGIAEHQERCRWLDNRAENLHRPFRRRERATVKIWNQKIVSKIPLYPFFSLQSH